MNGNQSASLHMQEHSCGHQLGLSGKLELGYSSVLGHTWLRLGISIYCLVFELQTKLKIFVVNFDFLQSNQLYFVIIVFIELHFFFMCFQKNNFTTLLVAELHSFIL